MFLQARGWPSWELLVGHRPFFPSFCSCILDTSLQAFAGVLWIHAEFHWALSSRQIVCTENSTSQRQSGDECTDMRPCWEFKVQRERISHLNKITIAFVCFLLCRVKWPCWKPEGRFCLKLSHLKCRFVEIQEAPSGGSGRNLKRDSWPASRKTVSKSR